MIDNKPLLSICIPTYNRAQYLEKCLEQIVQQDGFDSQVEVVISDNCSNDNTSEICDNYQKAYSNIRYFRNEKNIVDMNFPLTIQRATGYLRKLTNDTVLYEPGAIQYMKGAAEKYKDRKPQIFFLNRGELKHELVINSIDEYVDYLGFLMTWIGSITIWDDDYEGLKTLTENANTRLGHVPYLLESFERRGQAVILDRRIMSGQPVAKKNLTYGLYNVFYKTFLGFIEPYVENGKVSETSYENVRKGLLLDFFCQWIVNREKYPEKYMFSDENMRELVEAEYKHAPYFGEYKRKLNNLRFRATVKKLVRRDCHGAEQ